ncbi:MAG: flagellar export protein FliJ [Planctomycetes bacterium]|nr:flagellar export protein FliJ [Planctomycetota bacterium]
MSFHFRLQPLLDKERIHENEFVRGLKVLKGVFQDEKEGLVKLQKERCDCQRGLEERRQSNVEAADLRLYEDYFVKIENDEKNCRCLLDEIKMKIEVIQRELTKMMKRRKALERLKEKGQEEYLKELQLSLNKEMDDVAMINFSKRR